MTLRLGDYAPDFKAETSLGPINFYEWAAKDWIVFLSHPKDFRPVCTTELGYLAKIKIQFDKRQVKILGLSVDTAASHREWIKDINETQRCTVTFPIVADENRAIAKQYNMIHPNEFADLTVRSIYLIDPSHRIRLIMAYPALTGRDFDELLRVIDSLQLSQEHKVATPANWRRGDDCVVVPSLATEDIGDQFPQGVREVKPYLRLTPEPH